MVIRHESSHYPHPPAMASGSGGVMHSYHPSSHGHAQQQHYHHQQRYHYPPHHHHAATRHHSPSNNPSPSHHAAVTLQSMQHQQYYYFQGQAHHPHHGHFHPQQQHGYQVMHASGSASSSPLKSSRANPVAPSENPAVPTANACAVDASEDSNSAPSKPECGFNMLIHAAATSESMNSIDESDPPSKPIHAKGILKKHPRGKTLVSPLENEENKEDEVRDGENKEERSGSVDRDAESLKSDASFSAGPLKKRRKVDDTSVGEDDKFKTVGEDDKVKTVGDSSFLNQLHTLLTNTNKYALLAEAMEWMSHGKAFRILRWDVFVEEVLPRYFVEFAEEEKDSDMLIHKFRGYLKEFGFVEVKRGKDYGCFCHEFFTKDDPRLIQKVSSQNSRTEHSPSPDYNEDIGRSGSGSSIDGGMEWRSTRRVAHSIFKLPRTGAQADAQHSPVLASRGESQSHPSYLHMPILTTTATASFAENWGTGEERNGANHHHHYQAHHGNAHSSSEVYFPRPYPPHNTSLRDGSKEGESGRSPKIIRFREDHPDTESARYHSQMTHHGRPTVPAIEISPNESSKVESNYVESREASDDKKLHYEMVQITPNLEYDQVKTTHRHVHFPVSRRGGRGMGRGGGVMRPVSVSRYQLGKHASS